MQLLDGRAHLPVAILARRTEGRLDVGTFEVRQRHHGAASHGGLVVERGDDGRASAVVADGAERRHRGLPATRVVMTFGNVTERHNGATPEMLPEREGRAVDDQRVFVGEERRHHVEQARLIDRCVRELLEGVAPYIDVVGT